MSGFLKQFLKSRMHVGAIAPSSAFLARRIVREAGVAEAGAILELGCGTGAFTGKILATKRSSARFLAIERNESFCDTLHEKFPGIELAVRDAQHVNLGDWLKGVEGFDSVVSGLPWAAFPEDLQRSILDHIRPHIRVGGIFTTFAYFGPHWLPAGRRFRKLLEEKFARVRLSQVEMWNLPPAFVYVAEAV